MSAIKRFFEKKKSNRQFKNAGEGHSLLGSSSSRPSTAPAQVLVSRDHKRSDGAVAAREAALRREQEAQQRRQMSESKNAAIAKRVRSELEQEKRRLKEIEDLEKKKQESKEEILEAPSVCSTTGGVFFRCSLLDSNLLLPYPVMEKAIRDFITSQLQEEPLYASILMVHTFTKDSLKVSQCISTLSCYLDNLKGNPHEAKYRKIRLGNKVFNERVANCPGGNELLQAVGFSPTVLPTSQEGESEDYLVIAEDKIDLDLLSTAKELLTKTEAIRPELCRNPQVFYRSNSSNNVSISSLPPDFFRISMEEFRKLQAEKAEAVERLGMLRTRDMREKDAILERRQYRFCLIRVRMPDEILLQATFRATEKLSDVYKFVSECLVDDSIPFILKSVSNVEDLNPDQTLLDLGLVPTTLLHFQINPSVFTDAAFCEANTQPQFSLSEELMKGIREL